MHAASPPAPRACLGTPLALRLSQAPNASKADLLPALKLHVAQGWGRGSLLRHTMHRRHAERTTVSRLLSTSSSTSASCRFSGVISDTSTSSSVSRGWSAG